MTGLRFKVAVVHGDRFPTTGHPARTRQLSAHVLDRLNAHRVVATFRSEDTLGRKHRGDRPGPGKRLGRERAIAAATARAAELNADERA